MTFPTDYSREELRGQEGRVRGHRPARRRARKAGELNDDFAKTLGLDDVAALRDAVQASR